MDSIPLLTILIGRGLPSSPSWAVTAPTLVPCYGKRISQKTKYQYSYLTAKRLYSTCTFLVFDSTSMFIDILIHVKIIVIHVLTFFKNHNLPVILKGHAINIAYTYNFIYSICSIFFKSGHNTKHVTISFWWAISILLFYKANWNHKMLLNCAKLKICQTKQNR